MSLPRISKKARLSAAIAMSLFSASVSTVYALPTGEQVQSGTAEFTRGESSLDIKQETERVAIDWTSFDIGSKETVNFYQPGADSIALLRTVCEKLGRNGYRVGNADCTVVAQAPKLMPYLPEMRKRIAEACGVTPDRISVKATTEEHLGFTGRGEGIAAHAVALIESL